MPATPGRKGAGKKSQSPAQSLVGCSVAIPSNIFNESDSQYTGRVVGTPSRKKNAVYVKVDQDDTEYWFPADEVASWVIQDTRPKATAVAPKTPRTRKQKQQADSPHRVSTAASSQPSDVHQKKALQNPTKNQDSTCIKTVATPAQDAASCHPEKPDAFAETVEELAATSADEISVVDHYMAWSMVAVAALLVVLVAALTRQGSTVHWMHQVACLWRAITRRQ